jgi:hypothetical protein
MSRLAQRLGAGVGITAGIRFARPFEGRLSIVPIELANRSAALGPP